MQELLDKMYEYVALYGMNIVAAIVIFVIGKWLARLVSNILSKIMEKAKVEKTLVTFIKNLSYTALLVFVIGGRLSPARFTCEFCGRCSFDPI